jgi:hypothetical protein
VSHMYSNSTLLSISFARTMNHESQEEKRTIHTIYIFFSLSLWKFINWPLCRLDTHNNSNNNNNNTVFARFHIYTSHILDMLLYLYLLYFD